MKHTCHWPDCNKPVPPAMWGCKAHWFKLPKVLRDEIWKSYRPGQETDKKPSAKYLAVAQLTQWWIGGIMELRKDGSWHPTQKAYEAGLVERPTPPPGAQDA